ncbi:acyl-CoA dehydrogenase family protein [Corynebacterium sp. H113]|uniref:acyl-CoA dehydrogenase family protein n=1 Tax=Corynebacterium sp. H113 TaxID=3133419 RepID=UPI0030B03934
MSWITEDQKPLVEVIDSYVDKHIAPNAMEWDEKGIFPVAEMKGLADIGVGALYCSEDHGGTGLTRADGVVVFNRIARGCPVTAAYLSIHNMVTWMIDEFGTEEQRAEFIPQLAAMDKIGSYCLTEPDAGSDAANLTTRAVRDGDEWVLNGVKQFISGAGVSDVYLVMARTGDSGAKGISAFIVDKDTEGLSFGANEKKMGWKNQPTAQVIMDNVRVPAGRLVGGEQGLGMGFTMAMRGLNGGRINIAACALGGAEVAHEAAAAHLRDRNAFGQKLIDNDALRQRLADMATDLMSSRLMLRYAADSLDSKAPGYVEACAMAKLHVTERCYHVADEALQLHGGYGYLQDYAVERIVRDLRVMRILEGTNEIMRLMIGRAVGKGSLEF